MGEVAYVGLYSERSGSFRNNKTDRRQKQGRRPVRSIVTSLRLLRRQQLIVPGDVKARGIHLEYSPSIKVASGWKVRWRTLQYTLIIGIAFDVSTSGREADCSTSPLDDASGQIMHPRPADWPSHG